MKWSDVVNKFGFQGPLKTAVGVPVELAVAVLLLEVIRIDGTVDSGEIGQYRQLMQQQYGLSAEKWQQLRVEAEAGLDVATGYYKYTAALNAQLSIEDKIDVVASLWRLAMADGVVTADEYHLVRKVAELLHLRHAEYMRAKNKGLDVEDGRSG